MDDGEFNQLVCELADGDSTIEAVRLLRTRRGMSTTEAYQFVAELRRQLSPASS